MTSGQRCADVPAAGTLVSALGITNVRIYEGGIADSKGAGEPGALRVQPSPETYLMPELGITDDDVLHD
jgi:hypothetical protein